MGVEHILIEPHLSLNMALRFFALCLLVSCVTAALPRHGRGLRAPYLPEGTPTPPPQWIDQKLDHMSSGKGGETWKQRYFVNSSWWDEEKGPVFMMLGGEGPGDPAWLVADTNIMRNAQKYKALVFSVEHR